MDVRRESEARHEPTEPTEPTRAAAAKRARVYKGKRLADRRLLYRKTMML